MFKKLIVASIFGLLACGEKGDPDAPGTNGKDGAKGADGNNNKVVQTLYCRYSTSNDTTFSYWASLTSSGDVWVSAEVSSGTLAESSSRFYVTYHDVGVIQAFTFPPNSCTINNY